MKYDSNGDLQWVKQAGTSSNDVGNAICVTSDGKFVFITGFVGGDLFGQPNAGII